MRRGLESRLLRNDPPVRICPDCRRELRPRDTEACSGCGWKVARRAGIPEYLSSSHRASPIVAHYTANYERIAGDDLVETMQGDEYLDSQAERLLGELGELEGLNVLDLGMGQGRLLDRMHASGATITGVDIVTPYLERYRAAEGTTVLVANAENLPFEREFDLIVAADILEHVLNLGDALLSIYRALVPGGCLVARVPYKENLLQYAHLAGGIYDLVHLRDFNKENLARSLRTAGFELGGVNLGAFHHGRKRRWVTRFGPVDRAVDRMLVRRHGSLERVHEIRPLAGKALMVPTVITATARRPSPRP